MHNSFTFLDDDSLERLESDYKARVSYLDLLSLLQDLLVMYATDNEQPRFVAQDNYKALSNLVHAFSSSTQIGSAARDNVQVAEQLHSSASRNQIKGDFGKPKSNTKSIDLFLEDLLKQYNLIRVIRSRGSAPARR